MGKREVRVIEGIEYLQCGKCKKWKEFNGFGKGGKYKDGTQKEVIEFFEKKFEGG